MIQFNWSIRENRWRNGQCHLGAFVCVQTEASDSEMEYLVLPMQSGVYLSPIGQLQQQMRKSCSATSIQSLVRGPSIVRDGWVLIRRTWYERASSWLILLCSVFYYIRACAGRWEWCWFMQRPMPFAISISRQTPRFVLLMIGHHRGQIKIAACCNMSVCWAFCVALLARRTRCF